jgi:hypothetical protein
MGTYIHVGLSLSVGKFNKAKKINNGIVKRYLEFFKSKEEMVACPPHHCIIVACSFNHTGRNSPRSIYLHLILKNYGKDQSTGNYTGIGIGPDGLLPHH